MNVIPRNIPVVVAAAAVLALAACSQQAPEASSSAAAQQAPAEAAPQRAREYPVGIFEQPAVAALRTGGNCSLDLIAKQRVGAEAYATGSELLFTGWFVPPSGVVATQGLVVFDDGARQFAHRFATGGKREDVARHLGRPDAAESGYNAKLNLAGLPAGEYAVWLAQEGEGGFRCPTKKTITITG